MVKKKYLTLENRSLKLEWYVRNHQNLRVKCKDSCDLFSDYKMNKQSCFRIYFLWKEVIMNLKEKKYKKSSGLDSVRFWLQGHRFVKFMLDITFYIILFLVIEFTTSQNKSIPADFRYRELLFPLQLNLFILGNRLYALFLSVKTEKERTLKRFCEPFIYINILSFIFQLIGVRKRGRVVLSPLFSLESSYIWFPIVVYLLVLMLTLAIFFLSKGSKKE